MDPSTPPPPTPSSQPHLNPQLCFNTTALRDFLRLSRSTVDDSLSLHLNSLLTPSRTPFLPSTTSARPVSPSSTSRRQIPSRICQDFKTRILFPSWQARQDVLTYCATVADSPADPPAPLPPTATSGATVTAGVMRMPSDKMGLQSPGAGAEGDGRKRSRNYWGQEQVIDERTDPYSARDYSYTREGRGQVLKEVLEREAGVEGIVRARTWGVLGERCLEGEGGFGGDGYEEEWRAWREGRRR